MIRGFISMISAACFGGSLIVATLAFGKALPSQNNSIGMRMLKVPAGDFMMGDSECKEVRRMCADPYSRTRQIPCKDRSTVLKCEGDADEIPRHKVTIGSAFWISHTEITQAQYFDVMGTNPSQFTSVLLGRMTESHPVEGVSWADAIAFANQLSDMEGLSRCYSGDGEAIRWDTACKGYRLPTEAEWEYAARSGQSLRYAGSDDLKEVAWFIAGNQLKPREKLINFLGFKGLEDLKGVAESTLGSTQRVAMLKPNAWGLFDMTGNVAEWVWDRYGAETYKRGEVSNPKGPSSGWRVYRGGHWSGWDTAMRISNRLSIAPDTQSSKIGFRLVRAVP